MRLGTIFSPRSVVLVMIAGVYLGFAVALEDVLTRWDKFVERSILVLQFRCVVLLLGILCLAVLLWRLRKGLRPWLSEIRTWLPVRLALYTGLLAVAVTTLVDLQGLLPEKGFVFHRFFGTALLAGLGLWAVLLLTRPGWFARPLAGIPGMLDIALFNLVVVLVLLEAVVTVWASQSTSPLFVDAGTARANIERQRPEPHTPHFNFAFNSLGYHDAEFFRAEPEDFVVALIADSFGVGTVPYDFNFATVAEKRLMGALGDRHERIAIHNFGILAVDIPEYALIQREALKTNPHFVMLSIFVGNDIGGLQREKRWRVSFRNWWIAILARRLWIVWTEPEQVAALRAIGAPIRKGGRVPAFVHDPSKERPSFSKEEFLEIELGRLNMTNAGRPTTRRRYREFFRALDMFHASLGDRLLLIVIPDEYQVNDTLYQRLLAIKERPEIYDRDLPQRLMRDYAAAKGIPMLDLLPVLRAAEPEGRTYHLRDTHWNARGNRIAGEAVADFILDQLD